MNLTLPTAKPAFFFHLPTCPEMHLVGAVTGHRNNAQRWTHTHTHAPTDPLIPSYPLPPSPTYSTPSYMCTMHTHKCIHTYTLIPIHIQSHIFKHTYTHKHIHTCTHECTHTHTLTGEWPPKDTGHRLLLRCAGFTSWVLGSRFQLGQ